MNPRRLVLVTILAAVLVALGAYLYTQNLLAHKSDTLPEPLARILAGAPRTISVSVRGLREGRIPVSYTCDSQHPQPPHITWNSVNGAKAYAVIVVDPDAPIGLFVHLVAYDGREARWPSPGYKLGLNTAGQPGWFPVCPPRGDKPHHYYFIIIALREPLGLPAGTSFNEVLAAMHGDIVAYGYTVGVYSR